MDYKRTTCKGSLNRQLVVATACLFCMSIAPAFARDSFGLIDLIGKEIIPCKYRSMEYVGCGLYLAEELPDARTQPTGAELLSSVPKELVAFIKNHGKYSAKLLFARNGKRILVPIPKDAVLTDIMLPSKEKQWDLDMHERPAVSNNGKIPKDAFLFFVNKHGFGICNAIGKVLVEPNIRGLEDAKENDGFLLDLYSAGNLFHPKQDGKVPKPRIDHRPDRYSEGLTVRLKDGRCSYVDRSGKRQSPEFAFADPFVDGIALVSDRSRIWRNWGRQRWDCYFIDRNFKRISPKYFAATEFHNGTAIVTLDIAGKQEVGVIDRNFHYSFVCNGDRQISFLNGHWILTHPIAPTICLDKHGRELLRTPKPAYPKRWTKEVIAFNTPRSGEWFFYDRNGRRLPPLSVWTSMSEPNYYPFAVTTNTCEWRRERGIIGMQYNWLLKPEFCDLEITERNRCIKSMYGKFEKEDWLQSDDNRYREFYAFLREHSPIGMTKDQIEQLLGRGDKQEVDSVGMQEVPPDPNIASYQLNWFGAWCGSSTWFAEFRYQNDRVKEWRIYKRTEGINPWIRS